MFAEVVSYLAEDDAQKESVEVWSLLENFCRQIENMVESSLEQYEQGRQVGEQGCVEEWNRTARHAQNASKWETLMLTSDVKGITQPIVVFLCHWLGLRY